MPRPDAINRCVTNEGAIGFLDLPGEIRNMIYEHALLNSHYAISFTDVDTSHGCSLRRVYYRTLGLPDRDDLPGQTNGTVNRRAVMRDPCPSQQAIMFSVALLQTCEQINAEAASIFYGRNLFCIIG